MPVAVEAMPYKVSNLGMSYFKHVQSDVAIEECIGFKIIISIG